MSIVWMLSYILGLIPAVLSLSTGSVTVGSLGVVASPERAVFYPIASWNHYVKLHVPCAASVSNDYVYRSIDTTLSVIADLSEKLSVVDSASHPKSRGALSALISAGNELRTLSKEVRTILTNLNSYGNTAWGLYPHFICTIAPSTHFRKKKTSTTIHPILALYTQAVVRDKREIEDLDDYDVTTRTTEYTSHAVTSLPSQVTNRWAQTTTTTRRPNTTPPDHGSGDTYCGKWCRRIEKLQNDAVAESYIISLTTPKTSRIARALLPFVGDIENFLWGTARETDLKDIRKAIKMLSAAQKQQQQFVVKQAADARSMSQVFSQEVSMVAARCADRIDNLTTSLNNTLQQLMTATGELNSAVNDLTTTVTILTLMHTMDSLRNQLTRLLVGLHEVVQAQEGVAHTAITGQLSIQLVNVTTLSNILKLVSDSITPSSRIIPYASMKEWYQTKIASCVHMDGMLHIEIRIPLVRASEDYSSWQLSSTPIFIGDKWLMVPETRPYLTLDYTNEVWTEHTENEFLECRSDSLGTCYRNAVWQSFDTRSCSLDIVTQNTAYRTTCNLVSVVQDAPRHTYISRLSNNTWFLSSRNMTLSANRVCRGDVKMSEIVRVSSLSTISLSPHCYMEVGGYTLVGWNREYGKSESESRSYVPLGALIQNDNTSPGLINVDVVDKKINLTRWAPQIPLKAELHSLMHDGRVKVDAILAAAEAREAKFVTEGDALRHKVDVLMASPDPENATAFGWMLPSWLPSAQMVFNCSVVIWLVLVTVKLALGSRRARLAGKTIVAGAFPMAPLTSATADNPVVSKYITHCLCNSSMLTPAPISRAAAWWIFVDTWSMWIMIAVMIYLHISCFRRLTVMVRRAVAELGGVSRNSTVVHNIGEVKLVVVFLAKVQRALGRKAKHIELMGQLCTLPGSIHSWTCDVTGDTLKTVSGCKSSRYRNNMRVAFSWGPLCLKSSLFPDVDTCKELPDRANFRMSEILTPVTGILPWGWWSITPVVITHLHVMDIKESKMIYTYGRALRDQIDYQ